MTEPQTWHHGVIARWWAEFNVSGPEIAYFQKFIEDDGQPALDVACGTGRLLIPYLRAGLDVDGCDISTDMLALCRERAEREGLTPNLYAQAMHELDLPRLYRTIVVCGGFGLGGNREQNLESLRRLYEQLEPGGLLLLDNEVPYADAGLWRYWLKEERQALPMSWRPPGERRCASDGTEYELRSRRRLRPAGAVSHPRNARRHVARRAARSQRGAHSEDGAVLHARAAFDAGTHGVQRCDPARRLRGRGTHGRLRLRRLHRPQAGRPSVRGAQPVRIDKWLWAARFFKTRAAATAAVLGGRVHLNGVRVKPSREIRPGDRLEVTIGVMRRSVVVNEVADKRGPARVAATLYEETLESIADRERHALERRFAAPLGADLGARPTKQARRRLEALRRSQRGGRRKD